MAQRMNMRSASTAMAYRRGIVAGRARRGAGEHPVAVRKWWRDRTAVAYVSLVDFLCRCSITRATE